MERKRLKKKLLAFVLLCLLSLYPHKLYGKDCFWTATFKCYAYWEGSITATGKTARRGLVAVDPKVIGYHSKLYIEDYGKAYAEDCGGDIKNYTLDLRMDTEQECDNWGIRYKKVVVYY